VTDRLIEGWTPEQIAGRLWVIQRIAAF